MDSPHSSYPGAYAGPLEASSLGFLLQRGIDCTRQGSLLEGAAYFALVRERLTPDQTHITQVLDAFLQSHVAYLRTQESLHLVARHFVDADAERQTRLLLLEKLLVTSGEALYDCPAGLEQEKLPALSSLQTASDAGDGLHSPPSPAPPQSSAALPALSFTCFGRFEARCQGKPIALCASRSGQAILRYLIAQHGHAATSDVLMALFWPEEDVEVARNKLHIAISALRRALNSACGSEPGRSYILCENRKYYLNPAVEIRTDVDEFLECYQAAQREGEPVASLYERACNLYTGHFLPEDIYADWSSIQRERLSQVYLTMCRTLTDHYLKLKHYDAAAKWAITTLQENRCDELAHRQLMQIYAAKGNRAEAIKQFQRYEHILREELGLRPMPETSDLLQWILTSDVEPR